MQPRDHLAAARRWAKFPATVLFVTGVLWLLQKYLKLDWSSVSETAETGAGALFVFTDIVVIPLGTMVIGVCVMFLQRWALWGTGVILALPLALATIGMVGRVDAKFSKFHLTQDVADFGAGIMTAIEILAVWAIYLIAVYHVRKALYWHHKARQWTRRPETEADRPAGDVKVPPGQQTASDSGVCLLMPDCPDEDHQG